jgi:hypothetical protein
MGKDKGQSNVVSFVLLVALGSIVGVSLYFAYAGTAPGLKSQLDMRKQAEARALGSSIALHTPEAVMEEEPYYAVIYNSGNSHLTGLGAYVVRSGVRTNLGITDKDGTVLTTLPIGELGYIKVSEPPQDPPQSGETLVVGSEETFTHKTFTRNTKQVRTVDCTGCDDCILDELEEAEDESYDEIAAADTECYTFDVDFTEGVYDELYLDAYVYSSINLTFYEVEYSGAPTALISDNVSIVPAHVVYDLTSDKPLFWTTDEVEVCIRNKGDADDPQLVVDYMRVVVVRY